MDYAHKCSHGVPPELENYLVRLLDATYVKSRIPGTNGNQPCSWLHRVEQGGVQYEAAIDLEKGILAIQGDNEELVKGVSIAVINFVHELTISQMVESIEKQ